MSHITQIKEASDIKNLTALARAATRCGLEFRQGQTKFKGWYVDRACDHAIAIRVACLASSHRSSVRLSRRTEGLHIVH